MSFIFLIICSLFNFLNVIIEKIIAKKWGLGIGDWGLGIGDWAQSPIPNPQSPIPNPQSPYIGKFFKIYFNKKFNELKFI